MEQAIDYSYKQIAELQQLNAQLKAFIFDRKSFDDDHDSFYLPINSHNFDVQEKIVENTPNTAQIKKRSHFSNKIYVDDIISEDFDKKEINYLKNGEYVLCGTQGDYKISMYVFDNEKCLASQHAVYESPVRFSIRTSHDLIYLKLYDMSMNESLLHVFDSRLELLKTSSRLNGSFWMSTDDQFVYLIELNKKDKSIRVYSHELDLLYTVDILFENWKNVNGFLVKDNMFFIFNRDYYIFRIGDMQTGLLLNEFCIEKAFIRTGQSFCIFRKKIVVLESTKSGQCLNFYTTEGELVKSIPLDLETYANDLIYKNNQPRLYDHHNHIIYKLNADIFKFK